MSSTRESSTASPDMKDIADTRRRELEQKEQEDLYAALGRSTLDVCNMLLRNQIHPDANVLGTKLLSRAYIYTNFELVEFLIMNGACLGNNKGRGMLLTALGCSEPAEKCIELLVRHKADLNTKDSSGHTILMYALAACSKTTLKLLLEHRADVHAEWHGETALDVARELADQEVIDWIQAAAKKP